MADATTRAELGFPSLLRGVGVLGSRRPVGGRVTLPLGCATSIEARRAPWLTPRRAPSWVFHRCCVRWAFWAHAVPLAVELPCRWAALRLLGLGATVADATTRAELGFPSLLSGVGVLGSRRPVGGRVTLPLGCATSIGARRHRG